MGDQLREKEKESEHLSDQIANLKTQLASSSARTEQMRRQMEDESADRTTSHEQIVTRYREQATAKELMCVELQDQVILVLSL